MRCWGLFVHLVPLFVFVNLNINSVNAKANPQISTYTTSPASLQNILSKLRELPLTNLTQGIKEYDNKFGTLFFGDIISAVEFLRNKLSPSEIEKITEMSTNAFCYYVRSLEMSEDEKSRKCHEFEVNEKKLRELIEGLLEIISKAGIEPVQENQNNLESGRSPFKKQTDTPADNSANSSEDMLATEKNKSSKSSEETSAKTDQIAKGFETYWNF